MRAGARQAERSFGALDAVTCIELDLTTALVRYAAGNVDAAHATLDAALELAAGNASIRPVLAAGPAAEPLRRAHVDRGGPSGRLAARLLADRRAPGSGAPSAPAPRRPTGSDGPDLTARELSVLQLLPSLLTAHEIAAHLYVTTHTVRHHLKAIYRKLDAGTRRQAVARAVELGIIGEITFLRPDAPVR